MDDLWGATMASTLARELIRYVEVFGWRHAAVNVDVETRGCWYGCENEEGNGRAERSDVGPSANEGRECERDGVRGMKGKDMEEKETERETEKGRR